MTACPPGFQIRAAVAEDVPAIAVLLADDMLGAARELPADPIYATAFAAVQAQAGNSILIALDPQGRVCGCLQLTLIPGLSRRGSLRAQIEGVRVGAAQRGLGLGETLVRHAIAQAKSAGADLVQLTTDIRRQDAQRFYQRLGFTPSHVGMKLSLSANGGK
jgi:ribosomal protein S18 acetylase RimI-like enzyme